MRHPTEGVLRRLLDEPAGVADADRHHIADCAHCLDELATARDDAALVDAAIADLTGDLDVDAAWRRLSTAAKPTRATIRRRSRLRDIAKRPAVAGLAVALVLTGAGTAAANDWLKIFSTERIAPVSISAADLVALPDLSSYGELVVSSQPDVHPVADAAAAEAETGLDVPEVPDLPRGVSGNPEYQVGGEVVATFTFDVERAARAAADVGETLPPLPPGVDGASVRLVAGPGVAQVWLSDAGIPALVVGRATAPTAFSDGVPFEVLRDYLLSLPGLPDDVAAQLRTFTADGATLPLPVPSGEIRTSFAQVGDARATVLTSRDRALAAVVWVDGGEVTAVAGSLDADELLSVARGLR